MKNGNTQFLKINLKSYATHSGVLNLQCDLFNKHLLSPLFFRDLSKLKELVIGSYIQTTTWIMKASLIFSGKAILVP